MHQKLVLEHDLILINSQKNAKYIQETLFGKSSKNVIYGNYYENQNLFTKPF